VKIQNRFVVAGSGGGRIRPPMNPGERPPDKRVRRYVGGVILRVEKEVGSVARSFVLTGNSTETTILPG